MKKLISMADQKYLQAAKLNWNRVDVHIKMKMKFDIQEFFSSIEYLWTKQQKWE